MNGKKPALSHLIFMALCCDMGIFLKKLIAPATNAITGALHIPGGIGTSFSIMFILIAAVVCNYKLGATLMGLVQGLIAIAVGTMGSMGILAPIGYVIPGIVIDLLLAILKKFRVGMLEKMIIANAAAGVSAALCANIITFRLKGPVLLLYLSVALTSGVVSGILGEQIVRRIYPVINKNDKGI